MKKYIIVSDFVKSKSDGDEHFISNSKLVDLYKVRHEECEFTTAERFHFDTLGMDLDKMIILRPRYDGNYTLPKENK